MNSSPSGTARVAISESDEPACGSEMHMVPNQRPDNWFAANTRFCASVPCTISRLALAVVSLGRALR